MQQATTACSNGRSGPARVQLASMRHLPAARLISRPFTVAVRPVPKGCRVAIIPCRASSSSASSDSSGQSLVQSLEQSTDWALTASTVASVGLSAVLTLAPSTAFRQALSAIPTSATQSLLQHVGVSAWPVAAILYVLGDAARHHRLSSDTYQRLASYVTIGFGIAAVYAAAASGNLGLAWRNEATAKSMAFAFFAVPAAGAVAAITAGIKATGASSSWAGSQATALRNALQKLTAANKSAEGTLYQGLAFLLPLGLPLLVFRSVFGHWLWPLEAVNQLGPVHGVLLKVLTLEAVGAAIAAFSLKDAENRGRLGGGTFKLLKASLAAQTAGHLIIGVLARSAAASTMNQVAYGGLAALTAAVVLKWLSLEAKRFNKE